MKSKAQPKKPQPATIPTRNSLISEQSLLPFIFIVLYAVVDFIPRFEGGDVMGSQWIYLNILNLLTVVYFIIKKTGNPTDGIIRVSRNVQTLLFAGILILAAISIFYSVNRIEAIVVYARLINSGLMYFNLAILLYGNLKLLRPLAYVLTVFLLIQSISTLNSFYKGIEEANLTTVIYNLKGNAGNKNILAASLMTKMAFCFYCIYISGLWVRIAASIVAILGGTAIFLLNARASYIGILLILLLYIIFTILLRDKKSPGASLIQQLAAPPLVVILAFFISQGIFKNALKMQDQATDYGTVTERLSTISFSAEGSNARFYQWSSAVDYIKNHPLKGSGYGNWKLVSIPYEKEYVDDLFVTYHVHNDFLEMAAELGVVGGILFLGLFLCVFLFSINVLFKPGDNTSKSLALLTIMALAAYSIDSFFNFPLERPVMQFFFALMLASGVNLLLNSKESKKQYTAKPLTVKLLYAGIAMLLLLPALYLNIQTYKSFVAQTKVNKDMTYPQPATKWEDIKDAFPAIPNMNAYCFPIDQIKAFYLMQEKQYDSALTLINNSEHINPYLPLGEFFKAKIFLAQNKLDSAYYYAYTAFFSKPRAKSSYELLNEISIKKGDTATLYKAFREYTRYRNEPWAWNRYLGIMMYMPNDRGMLTALADTAVKKFPNDPELKQKLEIFKTGEQQPAFTAEQQAAFLNEFNTATNYYVNRNYPMAIRHFTKASELNPNDYISVENIGLSYFAQNNFKAALPFLEKVIKANATTDGKSEYFRGLCLLNTGRKNEGCVSLRQAVAKNYVDAKASLDANCGQ